MEKKIKEFQQLVNVKTAGMQARTQDTISLKKCPIFLVEVVHLLTKAVNIDI